MEAGKRAAILDHLRSALASRPFQKNRRARVYLHYVVTESMNGRAESLSKASIAAAVFGRDDERSQAWVRDKAGDVERRLALFYELRESFSPVWFALDWSSLAPFIGPAVEQRPPLPVDRIPRKAEEPMGFGPGLAAVAIFLGGIVSIMNIGESDKKTASPAIWNPFLNRDRVVILCEPLPSAGTRVLGSILRDREATVDAKMGTQVTRTDIRMFPTILLAGCTSPWSDDLAKNLRFQQNGIFAVTDTKTGKPWLGVVITRILDSGYGQPLLMVGGLPQVNEPIVERLKDSKELAQILGPNWITKNFQIVAEWNMDGTLARISTGHSW